MSVHSAHNPVDHSASPGVRRGVAAGVVLLHAVVVLTIAGSQNAPVVEMPAAMMVSVVSGVPEAPVAPPAPAVSPEVSPVLATERQLPVESAPVEATKPAETVVTEPVSAPSSDVVAPPSDEAVPAAVSSVVSPPSFGAAYLNNPRPAFPLASRRLREEGVTVLLVQVTADGKAQLVEVQHSSGFARLDLAARKAVRDWRFVPAREGNVAVAGWVTVPINWKLDN